MRELRRLLVDQRRILDSRRSDFYIALDRDEFHYLNRVLRLRNGDLLNVVDGEGNLWEATICKSKELQLTTSFENPLIHLQAPKTKICLAVVIPKQGFDEILRMGCEIGVDIFQPLTSDYRVKKSSIEFPVKRWKHIVKEAVEQSERLWMPEIRSDIKFEDLFDSKLKGPVAIATTRRRESIDFQLWTNKIKQIDNQISVLIGPEGGWSDDELTFAIGSGCVPVTLGENILRTTTAAVSVSQLLVAWRRVSFNF